jgi:hypothetical protein
MVQANGMVVKLLPMTLFTEILGLFGASIGGIKNLVPTFVPGFTKFMTYVSALIPLPFAPAGPAGPVAPAAPAGPVAPAGPCGIVKLRIAAELVPEFVTEADVPDEPVVVVPTLTVEDEPARASTAQCPPDPATSVAGSMALFVTSAM